MQQRQLRLGDILDDYCPRERRVTNHAIVAMVGDDVKQTRCTTCDAEHEYKHAKVPRQRRKTETPAALYAQVLANGPKRVVHENHDNHENHENGVNDADAAAAAAPGDTATPDEHAAAIEAPEPAAPVAAVAPSEPAVDAAQEDVDENERDTEEGPIHRRLIRASLPRPEGQQPPARPIPEFTIRQPGGRPNRFRPRHQRGGGGGQAFGGNRSNGSMHGAPPRGMRQGGGRPPQGGAAGRRHERGGRKRSK